MASPTRLPARRPPPSNAKARPTSMFEVPTEHLKRLQQIGDGGRNGDVSGLDRTLEGGGTSKQSKRRSLLPTFSRRTPTEDEKDVVATIREDTSDSEVSQRPSTRDDKIAMPPPPKPSRPTSMRLGANAPARTTSLHAKTSSRDVQATSKTTTTPTAAGQRFGQGAQVPARTSSTRVPAGLRAPATTTSTQHSIPARASSTRATTSTIAQKRSSAVISKPPALENGLQHDQGRAPPASPTSSTTSRPSTRHQAKPSFSTYQQHYSPAKSALPKPPVPSAKSAPQSTPPTSTEAEVAITFDIALEQVELLQLSLIHQSSAQILAEYETSARSALNQKHTTLRRQYELIRSHEQEQRRLTNLAAIETWCPDEALLAEHLQTLSRVLTALQTHTEPGSRYSELADTFDSWATNANSTLFDDDQVANFIEALPESWRASHTSLALKLRSIQRDLDTLPPVPPASTTGDQSSLEVVLESCSSLVDDMLRGLELMTKLQKEVLQRGKARIDEQINALVLSQSTNDSGKEKWVPAWTSVT